MTDIAYTPSRQTISSELLCSLTLKNKLDELSRLSVWINHDVAVWFDLSEKTTFKMDLVLAELIANIISYAYPDQSESEILIRCHRLPDNLRIEIEDSGVAFNLLAMPEVELPESLDEAEIGGLGIHLIRNYIDDGDYQRQNDKNIFSMSLKL